MDTPAPITPEKRRALADAFEKSRLCFRAERHDEAHQILAECIVVDPANLLYVEALLQNLHALGATRGASWLAKLFDSTAARFEAAERDSQWLEMLRLAPSVLRSVGLRPEPLNRLAVAAQNARCHDVELRYWDEALRLAEEHPSFDELTWRASLGFARQGAFAPARCCWERLAATEPNGAAARALAVLGGFGQADQRDKTTDIVRRFDAETQCDATWLVEQSRELAERWQFDAAEAVLQKASESSPGEWTIREEAEQLRLFEKRVQGEIAAGLAQLDDSPLAEELVQRINEDLIRLEIEHFHVRCGRYPDEPQWRFELARRLKQADMHFEAAEQYEATIRELAQRLPESEPERRGGAEQITLCLLERGESFQMVRQFPRALECYLTAEQWAEDYTEPELDCRDRIQGRLAVLAEAMGRFEVARTALTAQLARNPSDESLRDRLDKLGLIGDKG